MVSESSSASDEWLAKNERKRKSIDKSSSDGSDDSSDDSSDSKPICDKWNRNKN